MTLSADDYIQSMLEDREAVGFIPGTALNRVLAAWQENHPDALVLRGRVPYQPGRKDRQLAAVLLQALGRPPLSVQMSSAQAWKEIARLFAERGYSLLVIENADLLDKNAFEYLNRRLFPALILVGGPRLQKKIGQAGEYVRRVRPWMGVGQPEA